MASPKDSRPIVRRTRGAGNGFITRLMSPSDLGHVVKPFVFLDIFTANRPTIDMMKAGGGMSIHPHSGIATVTVFTEGHMRYDDPDAGTGTLSYGGVEWMRAGGGVWHGKEMSPGDVARVQGFQLWLALPPELENGPPVSRYIEAADMASAGPAIAIIGAYQGAQSPVPAPDCVNYLLVTLRAGESWIYRPPSGHSVGWLAVAQGVLDAGSAVAAGEMVVFEQSEAPIALTASRDADAVFVLGSAVPHPYPLHLGNYSVHTTAEALAAGERRIAELGRELRESGDRRTAAGTVPVFR